MFDNEKLFETNKQRAPLGGNVWLQKHYGNILERATKIPKNCHLGFTVIAFIVSLLVLTTIGKKFSSRI